MESDFDAPNTRLFKSLTDVELATVYFGGGPPEKFQLQGNTWPTDWRPGDREPTPAYIVCAHIQVVYAGVNLTSPDACAQTTLQLTHSNALVAATESRRETSAAGRAAARRRW